MFSQLPLHSSTGGSPITQLSPRMTELNNNFQNLEINNNNNENDIWNVSNSPLDNGLTEEVFYQITQQLQDNNENENDLNTMIENYLNREPQRLRNRGEPKQPDISNKIFSWLPRQT